jgi:hypothetical protein|tara:strand:+ start:156 stop:359 length:204 start_codon:yes stop_codon:yes gene_type:complete
MSCGVEVHRWEFVMITDSFTRGVRSIENVAIIAQQRFLKASRAIEAAMLNMRSGAAAAVPGSDSPAI